MTTKFDKNLFNLSSGYLVYGNGSCIGKFVARFKYMRGSASSFKSFLIKNFTGEEYFARMDAGEAPLEILKSKGYLHPHVRKELKRCGFPETVEGFNQYCSTRR